MKLKSVVQLLAAWLIVILLLPLGGTDTVFAADPWVDIATAAEFNNIRSGLAANYRLMADIDLSGYPNWTPIGTDATRFNGQLDGNGKVIRNLSLTNTSTTYQGLFGAIGTTGKLTNVVVENANLAAGNYAGILAGVNYGQISASSAKGNLSGQDYVGGLVGSNAGNIINSFTQAQVTGKNNVGGLVGSNSGTVQTSYAASVVSPSVLNNYLLFDGVDDFIEIPHQTYYLTDSFTLEAWFQWDDVGTDNVQFITGKGFEQFEIHTGGGSGINGIRFIPVYRPETLYNDGRAYQDVYSVIQPGWFHVAAVWDYSTQTARVYINGQPQNIYQVGSNVGTIAPVPLANPAVNPYADNFENFTIGIRSDDFFPFKGKISDVRFWNTVRTSEQIYADKNKQLTGSEPGLMGYWKLNEPSGTVAVDGTSNHNDGTVMGGAVRVQEGGSNFGGLVGLNSGSVTGSYYDSVISGQTDEGKGSPQITSAMKAASTFIGWDFASIWKINEGSSYPYFNRISLSYSAGVYGTISGSASQTVSPGGTGSAVTAVANTNYKFEKWSDNLTTATRQDTNVTGNLNVTASFLEAVPPTTLSIVVSDTSLIIGETSTVTFTFSETVTGFTTADLTVGSGSLSEPSSSDGGITWTATLTPTANVSDTTNVITLNNSGVQDLVGNPGSGTTDSNNYSVDTLRPTATIAVADDSLIVGETSAVTFTFSEAVTGFTTTDLTVGSGSLSEPSSSDGGITWTATLTPSAGVTTLSNVITLDNSGVQDLAGNPGSGTTDSNNYAVDTTTLGVSVEQAEGQADPVNLGPILFTATFSEPVSGFAEDDISFEGSTAPGSLTAALSEIAPNDGTTYQISISGMSGNGTVMVSIPANRVVDESSNFNTASISSDNSVTFDTSNPEVTVPGIQDDYTGSGPASFGVNFNKAVYNPEGHNDPDDVTNPANYLLVKNGTNQLFDTLSCAEGLAPDDIQFAISSVEYDSETNTSTIRLASRLPVGTYRLFVCGTTSIVDLAGNPINDGKDAIFNFTVRPEPEELPETGFAPGKFTILPAQPEELAYTNSGLTLSIPSLGVQTAIVGVPRSEQSWDVSWLGNRAGYLYGSAYPTWQGNTVLTGHAWDADNTPGIFANLENLRYGDLLQIFANGQTFTYAVRENRLIEPGNVKKVMKHEELSWVTLLTCESYRASSDSYAYRRMVRAVLVSVE